VPTGRSGFSAKETKHKVTIRASIQCDLFQEDVWQLPKRRYAPRREGPSRPFACLNEARYGIIWSSMGAAKDCCECTLESAKELEQFGKPIAGFQLT
jgi:glutaryl-CoA dehydrogenase